MNYNDDYRMDLFIEKIVAKQHTGKDTLQNALIVIAGIIIILATMTVKLPPIVNQFILVIWAGVGYGVFKFTKSKNVEFEYAVTNGEIDIDKIIAQKKRKRIFSTHCRNFEIVAKVQSDKYSQSYANTPNKIFAGSHMGSEALYFGVLHYNEQRTIVYFEPDERMLKAFRTYIPSKVFN